MFNLISSTAYNASAAQARELFERQLEDLPPAEVDLLLENVSDSALVAAGDYSRSGMIALIPTAGNAQRLAVENGELPDDLHVTLMYLGDISDIDEETVSHLMNAVGEVADENPLPVVADGFNVALFNPHSFERDTCVTLGLSGSSLHNFYRKLRKRVMQKIVDHSYEIPEQHEPWIPHVTLAYSDDHSLVQRLADRAGDITFDRVRLALGDDTYDIPLGAQMLDSEWGDEDDVEVDIADDVDEDDFTAATLAVESTTVSYNDRGGEAVDEDELSEIVVNGDDIATGEPGAWSGVLIVEGVESGDGRMFAEGSLLSAPLPLPLMWQKQTATGHETAVQAGRIDELWRENNEIWGRGVFDMEGEDGLEAYRQVEQGFLRGVSGDVDSVKDADVEMVYPRSPVEGGDDAIADLFATPELTIFHRGRLRGATLVQFPAFVEASIALEGQAPAEDSTQVPIAEELPSEFAITELGVSPAAEPQVEEDIVSHLEERAELTACGCTDEAPASEWFEDPKLSGPTPLTVTEDGRIYGHAAVWGTCHTGFAGQCVTPPRERFHEYFLLGETLTADGTTVATGTITLGTGHAATGGKITAFEAIKHYDNTGTVVADIATGEDQHGLWFAGALRQGLSPGKLRALRAAKLSGDWRKFGNGLRLVALLAVNVPGFPVPRVKTASSRGRQVALVAAGVNHISQRDVSEQVENDALRSVVASMRKRIGRDEKSQLAALRNRIHGR